MKNLLVLIACIVLVGPAIALAQGTDDEDQIIGMIPKVVDSNWATVGYILSGNVVGINYNGKVILTRIYDGYLEERPLYFENNNCTGKPYVFATNGNGFGWDNSIGYINSSSLYVTTDDKGNSADVMIRSILYIDGTCDGRIGEQHLRMQVADHVCSLSSFIMPYKIRYGSQNNLTPLDLLHYAASEWLVE